MIAAAHQTIIFDFDGTLVDASNRLYSLFCDITDSKELSMSEYWSFKRAGVAHQQLLKQLKSEVSWEIFRREWMTAVEDERYLRKDKLYPKVEEVIHCLREEHRIILLSARQHYSGLQRELVRLGIRQLFDEVHITGGKRTKEAVIEDLQSEHRLSSSELVYLVGDTPSDIVCGQHFDFKTIAVSYGFANRERLERNRPHCVVDCFEEIKAHLNHW